MLRPGLLGLTFAMLLTACDQVVPPDPESVPLDVASVTIEGVPLAPNRTRDWDDDGTGPDLFVEIQTVSGSVLARTETTDDVDLTQPTTFAIPAGTSVMGTDREVFIVLFDRDGPDTQQSEQLGTSAAFTASEINTATAPLVLADLRAPNRVTTYEVAPR